MRTINEIIWHCTATPEGRSVTVDEINQWHLERGWRGIGYHYVVYLDGSVHKGRPVEEVGAHASGHNEGSIGAVYVGGTDADGSPKDTRTDAQKAAMEQLTAELVKKYDIKTIIGHRDVSNKACPCFDASAEYAHLLQIADIPGKQVMTKDRITHVFAWPSFNSFVTAVPPTTALNVVRSGEYTNDVHGHVDSAVWHCIQHANGEFWIHEQEVQ